MVGLIITEEVWKSGESWEGVRMSGKSEGFLSEAKKKGWDFFFATFFFVDKFGNQVDKVVFDVGKVWEKVVLVWIGVFGTCDRVCGGWERYMVVTVQGLIADCGDRWKGYWNDCSVICRSADMVHGTIGVVVEGIIEGINRLWCSESAGFIVRLINRLIGSVYERVRMGYLFVIRSLIAWVDYTLNSFVYGSACRFVKGFPKLVAAWSAGRSEDLNGIVSGVGFRENDNRWFRKSHFKPFRAFRTSQGIHTCPDHDLYSPFISDSLGYIFNNFRYGIKIGNFRTFLFPFFSQLVFTCFSSLTSAVHWLFFACSLLVICLSFACHLPVKLPLFFMPLTLLYVVFYGCSLFALPLFFSCFSRKFVQIFVRKFVRLFPLIIKRFNILLTRFCPEVCPDFCHTSFLHKDTIRTSRTFFFPSTSLFHSQFCIFAPLFFLVVPFLTLFCLYGYSFFIQVVHFIPLNYICYENLLR